MRKEIKNYRQLDMDYTLGKQSEKNQKIINKFLKDCRITASDSSIKKIKNKIVVISDTIQKPLDSLNLEDIRSFLVLLNQSEKAISTKNDIKKILKRFLKWKYKNWSSRFNQLQDVKLNTKNEKRDLSKQDLLTPDEMKLIVNSTDSLKYKLILLLMQETACRPEELLKIKWKDINMNNQEILLNSSKTGERREIPINKSIDHLKRYKTECFFETPRNTDFVFPNPRNSNKHVTTQSLSDFLFKLEKRLGFEKHLYPYLWRHSILTKMIKTLSPKVYEQYAGHSLETGMKIYAHIDNEDLKQELYDKVYNMEKLTQEERRELKEVKEDLKKVSQDLTLSQTYNSIFADYFTGKISEKQLKEKIEEFQRTKGIIKGKNT